MEVDLNIPEDFCMLSIDPGTDTPGFAISTVNNDCMHVLDAYSLELERVAGLNEMDFFEGRVSRLLALTASTAKACNEWNPVFVGCEAPYLKRMPNVFAALTEAVAYIQHGVWQHKPYMLINMVKPASAKQAVGSRGDSGNKTLVRDAVLQLKDLKSDIDLTTLDEHAIDAIAVGYYFYLEYFKGRL